MTEELEFFLMLAECYAESNGRPTGDVLREWEEHGIVQEVRDNYLMYHQERLQNAFDDIDHLLATGRHAW